MKIDNKLTSPLTGETVGENRATNAGNVPARSSGQTETSSADVRVSSLAAQLQAIENSLLSGEVVDTAKIAEIRQAIAEGRLKINPEAIADRLLDMVKDLLQESPGIQQ